MRRETLPLLACPHCHGALRLEAPQGAAPIQTGRLRCPACGLDYAIEAEIPRFTRSAELTGLNRRFAHLYDWFSYVYAPWSRVAFAFLGGEDRNRREVLDRLELSGGRVLEVSIGPGVNLPYLVGAPGVDEVYGLDISPGQLRQCQRLCRRRGWEVELFQGNAEQLPFQDEAFDCVFHIGGINFFNDKRGAMAEMARVARRGTKLMIVDENERGARLYDQTLPGFRSSFKGERPKVTAPVDLVPPGAEDVRLANVWRGLFYCLEFRKPRGE